MATIYVNIAVQVEVPDEDMEGYDNNAMQWVMDNIDVEVEAPNFNWWVDNTEID